MGIRTDLESQTPKIFHLTVVVSFVDSSIPCNNRDSSVNRPISNCIMIADNKFKNRHVHFTVYAVCSWNLVVYINMVKFDKGA